MIEVKMNAFIVIEKHRNEKRLVENKYNTIEFTLNMTTDEFIQKLKSKEIKSEAEFNKLFPEVLKEKAKKYDSYMLEGDEAFYPGWDFPDNNTFYLSNIYKEYLGKWSNEDRHNGLVLRIKRLSNLKEEEDFLKLIKKELIDIKKYQHDKDHSKYSF